MKLDKTVQVAENNREREQEKIDGIPNVVPERLDGFANEEYPHGKQNEPQFSRLVVPCHRGQKERVEERTIPEEGPVSEGGLKNRISTPWLNPARRVNNTYQAASWTGNVLTSKSPPGTCL